MGCVASSCQPVEMPFEVRVNALLSVFQTTPEVNVTTDAVHDGVDTL
jgi:hypothetical protein